MKATVVIPAYNEEKNITSVVSRLRKISRYFDIIVVDDGSSDNTTDAAKMAGARVLTLKKNQGKANACIVGSKIARCEKIIFIDADLQHIPEDIPKFVSALESCDLAIGVRSMSRIPVQRRIANVVARRLVPGDFSDVLCGFRAVRKSCLKKMQFKGRGYEFEVEMLIFAKNHGLRIIEVPVNVSYESYQGMSMLDSAKLLLFILRNRSN